MSRLNFRTEALLAATCLIAALLLGASELMELFRLTPPGGEAIKAIQAHEQHHWALVVLAVAAIVALAVATTTGSKPAAFAVAACGVIALLIFLIGDLPDANKIGTLDDARDFLVDAKAEPQAGFWFELVGALILSIAGTGYATLPQYRIKVFDRDRGGSSKPEAEERPRFVDWSRSE